MTPDLLRSAGEALHGPLWQRQLARGLNVNERAVRHWARGERLIPPQAQRRIAEICREQASVKATKLRHIAHQIERGLS